MIAEPSDAPPVSSPLPPTSASPRGGRPTARTMLLGALVLIGGLGGGALGAEAVISRLPATANTSATSSPAVSAASNAVAAQPLSAAALYKQAAPGIVTITTEVARRGGTGEGTGSGIVLDTSGNILTNAHVIAGASQIQVTFSDGGYAIGAPFGPAETMTAGIVSGLNRSNQGTGLSGLIQTDAPINPGNSGGALLNTLGQVIGVNDSIESPIAGNVGVGFAIPINAVKQLLNSLEGGANQ